MYLIYLCAAFFFIRSITHTITLHSIDFGSLNITAIIFLAILSIRWAIGKEDWKKEMKEM